MPPKDQSIVKGPAQSPGAGVCIGFVVLTLVSFHAIVLQEHCINYKFGLRLCQQCKTCLVFAAAMLNMLCSFAIVCLLFPFVPPSTLEIWKMSLSVRCYFFRLIFMVGIVMCVHSLTLLSWHCCANGLGLLGGALMLVRLCCCWCALLLQGGVGVGGHVGLHV